MTVEKCNIDINQLAGFQIAEFNSDILSSSLQNGGDQERSDSANILFDIHIAFLDKLIFQSTLPPGATILK